MRKNLNKWMLVLVYLMLALQMRKVECAQQNDRLNGLVVLQDGPLLDAKGYNNINMMNNGERAVLAKAIRFDDIVFDVGAHIGEWSLVLLNIQPQVSIYCFEPVPGLNNKLKNNLNQRPASINMLALSDVQGEATFVYYPNHPALSTLHRRPRVEQRLKMDPVFLNVALERLDNFCDQHQIAHINFLKIDTEGNELNVLRGAERLLLNREIDLIQFEYGGCYLDSNTTLKQVYELMTKYGYSIYRIHATGLIKISQWRQALENFQYSNYLAVKEERS